MRGWVKAADLRKGDRLVGYANLSDVWSVDHGSGEEVLFAGVHEARLGARTARSETTQPPTTSTPPCSA
jgi:hypothetical protein